MNSPIHIEREAALWVVRLERGLTATEQDAFLDWLTADPRHGDELTRQKFGWNRLNLLADWRPEHGRQPNRDLLAPPPAKLWRRLRESARRQAPVILAAAAAIAAGFFFFGPSPSVPTAPADPRVMLIEKRTLADGSTVELNRGAVIAVHYTPEERRIELKQGEAHFQVAKNPVRPFIVTVRGIDVRAVGTAFNVHLKASAIEVLVTEGQVAVTGEPQAAGPEGGASVPPVLLTAGHRTVIPLDRPDGRSVVHVSAAEIDGLLAWQPTLLDFTDAPLAAIVAEFNRRNAPIQLVISDPALAGTVLNASLRSDNIEGFLRLLAGGFGIEAERTGSVIVLHRSAAP